MQSTINHFRQGLEVTHSDQNHQDLLGCSSRAILVLREVTGRPPQAQAEKVGALGPLCQEASITLSPSKGYMVSGQPTALLTAFAARLILPAASPAAMARGLGLGGHSGTADWGPLRVRP